MLGGSLNTIQIFSPLAQKKVFMTAGFILIQAGVFLSLTQGTFLVGQPAQGAGKQGSSSSAGQAASSPTAVTQQAIRVTAGQKAAILAQVSINN